MLVALLIGDVLCNTVIKDIVQRARPFHHTEEAFYEWWQYVGAMAVMGALSFTGDRKRRKETLEIQVYFFEKHGTKFDKFR